jgi:hypothetical protein
MSYMPGRSGGRSQKRPRGGKTQGSWQNYTSSWGTHTTNKLVAAVKNAKKNEKIIECSRKKECAACKAQKDKRQQNQHPYPKCAISTRHWRWAHSMSDGGSKVFAFTDVFSRFVVNAVIKNEALKGEARILDER